MSSESTVDHELLHQLFLAAPDGILVVGDEGRIIAVNEQAARMFGYEAAELAGQPIEMLVPDSVRASHAALRSGYTDAPRPRPMGSGLSLYGRTKSGALLPVEIMLSPIRSKGRTHVCATVRDITERKRAARELESVHAMLSSAVESFHGAFAVFGPDDTMLLCNSTCRAWFGRALPGELTSRPYTDIIAANVRAGTFADDDNLEARWLAYHAQPEGSLQLRLDDGRELRLVERPIPGGGCVSTMLDVSTDVHREHELRQARAAAEDASRAKSEFLSSMSHELRTPLNAVLGFTQLLEADRKEPLSPRQRERLGHVLKAGEHLLRLIDDILDLSRIEAGRVMISVEPVALADVLAEVETTLAPAASHANITLAMPAVPKDAVVVADRTRLKQIILNFGTNAIKYGRDGGSATFSVEAHDDRIRLRVQDDGVGVPVRFHAQLFEPFQRAGQETGPVEGTGIGLAISKRLAELMGGSIGFRSEEGKGSTFWAELPAAPPAAEAPRMRTGASPDRGVVEGAWVIVYVEDNPSNIALMESFMEDYGNVRLLTAPSAEAGLPMVHATRPDVVLMDLNLPGISGFDAAERLRADPATAHIPIVAISAAAMPADRNRAAGSGFYRYLTKPIRVQELTETLDELLRAPRPE